jgi:hypothetical protein
MSEDQNSTNRDEQEPAGTSKNEEKQDRSHANQDQPVVTAAGPQ